MEREIERYFDLLRQRLNALQQMAGALHEGQGAFSSFDMTAIQRSIAQQENLCTELRYIDREQRVLQDRFAAAFQLDRNCADLSAVAGRLQPATAAHLRSLLDQIGEAQSEVHRLNRVHGALLRRSRRTVNILMNLLAGYSTATYLPGSNALPPGPAPSAPREA
ncbi:MAG: flagellar export chaperone FlgN [Acidobacteria bacterium]|nr:flagellar export chaperone FlgN [Acidobacteriota bacterium]MBI3662982.1 flagellar export chaperone FlgN [Acidobacteriota bacterium]